MNNQDPKIKIGGGLKEKPEDIRDFGFAAVHPLPKLSEIPDSFIVGKTFVDVDQGESDLCTGFSVAAANGDQEDVQFAPEYQFAMTKMLEGDFKSWGADIRVACSSAVKFGSLPKRVAPWSLAEKGRDFVANWENWPDELRKIAYNYAKGSYLTVTGPYDLFDNMRATMWANRVERRSIVTGLLWRYSWTYSPGGIIPASGYEETGVPHAFRIAGFQKINDVIYAVAPLTNGRTIGDSGVFYIPREVINRECKPQWGYYTFKDATPDEIKYLLNKGLTVKSLWWVRFWIAIKKLLHL